MRLAFVKWLREQRAFHTLDELGVAIARDAAQARALFEQIGL
jgi:FAD synthase